MEDLFLCILNMSLTALYVILAVLLLRLVLRRAPKKYSYLLWCVVGFRLLCPFSFSSVLSLLGVLRLPGQAVAGAAIRYVPNDIGMAARPSVTTGLPAVDGAINAVLPPASDYTSVNPMQVYLFLAAWLWVIGIAALLLYALFSLWRLHRQVGTAVLTGEGYWECENIGSPFVLGLFRPRIYLPYGLSEAERSYILTHERYHIKRGDHIVKLLAFLLLAVHWFNPLVWAAFLFMSRDMEMSCDEYVLGREGGAALKKAYSSSLLSFAANHRSLGPTPLAFGETGVKTRIKNVLRYKPLKVWASAAALALCLVLVVACAANPAAGKGEPPSVPTPAPAASIEPVGQAKKEALDYLNKLFSKDVFIWYEGNGAEVVAARPAKESLPHYQELFDEDWEEVDALVFTDGSRIGLGWGNDCFLFYPGTEYVSIVDEGQVKNYRVPSVNEGVLTDLSNDSIDTRYAAVTASDNDTFEEAADRWMEEYRLLSLQNTFPESRYAITDMAVVDREVTVTRDGEADRFIFQATLAVKPPEGAYGTSYWWIGNSYDGEGEWAGWILMTLEFRLERITDDHGAVWKCTEMGTGGMKLYP